MPFEVYGAIGDRYNELGGPGSWLGAPTSNERPFSEGGRVSLFDHGSIYWWPDTGAIDLNNIALHYKGLYCFSTTNGIGSDEPYVTIGTAPPPPQKANVMVSEIYADTDGGDSRPDNKVLYYGIPYGASLQCGLWEHDAGDKDAIAGIFKTAADVAAEKGREACENYGGPDVAQVCKDTWDKHLKEAAGDFFADLFGTGDDKIAAWVWNISPKEMVRAMRTEPSSFWGINYRMESPLLSGDGGDYKIYLDIVGA